MSTISNIQDYRNKQNENDFAEKVINLIEPNNYRTNTLEIVLKSVSKIMYFSGDVEPNEARKVRICETVQLLRVSSSQRYSVTLYDGIARLAFDGDYFYDLYFKDCLSDDLKAELFKCLDMECALNFLFSEMKQNKFNTSINELLK